MEAPMGFQEIDSTPKPFNVVPWEWQEVVCTCEEPQYYPYGKGSLSAVRDENLKWKCLACDKFARFLIMKCKKCAEHYLWNFKHHARMKHPEHPDMDGWARHKQLCWNCICAQDPATPDDVPPMYTESPRKARSLEEIDLGSITFDSFDF